MARKGSFGDFVSTLHFIIPQYVHQKKLKKIQTAEFVFKIKRLICTASRLISVGTLWDICTRYNLSKSAEEQRLVVICNTALSLTQPKSYLTSDASRIWKSSIHCLFEKKRACSELCVRLYSRAGSTPIATTWLAVSWFWGCDLLASVFENPLHWTWELISWQENILDRRGEGTSPKPISTCYSKLLGSIQATILRLILAEVFLQSWNLSVPSVPAAV